MNKAPTLISTSEDKHGPEEQVLQNKLITKSEDMNQQFDFEQKKLKSLSEAVEA